ncbi:hypothetical protein B0H10DRAFT_2003474 [Mycena sp. CBHHK59/15]|nr:hypothetical protein B0H10DRAFT_2003474 [Mycena sp. CBHHK59/15]
MENRMFRWNSLTIIAILLLPVTSGKYQQLNERATALGVASTTLLGPVADNSHAGKTYSRDGAYSGVVNGASSTTIVWTFQDTITIGAAFVDNSGALGNVNEPTVVTDFTSTGNAEQFIPFSAAEAAFNAAANSGSNRKALWSGSGVIPLFNNISAIWFDRFHINSNDVSTWVIEGNSVALVQIASNGAPVVTDRLVETLFLNTTTRYGSFAVTRGSDASDGYVYTYGGVGCCGGFASDLHLARVPVLYVGSASSYEIWDGTAYTLGGTPATVLEESLNSGTVTWSPYLSAYLMVYQTGFVDSLIYGRTATNLHGPWSERVQLFNASTQLAAGTFAYTVAAHPEYYGFSTGGKDLMVSYAVGGDPDIVIVQSVKITLS